MGVGGCFEEQDISLREAKRTEELIQVRLVLTSKLRSRRNVK